jgi:hypothetical protein
MTDARIQLKPEITNRLARAYERLLRCGERAAPIGMPGYETSWIGDDGVFLTVKRERESADFLGSNGFEPIKEEDGLLLYFSRLDDDDAIWRTWQAAWAFLARK